MALIKCQNCGKEISTNSERCIHCGTKLKDEVRTKNVIVDIDTENNIKKLNTISNVIVFLMFVSASIILITTFIAPSPIMIILFILCLLLAYVSPVFLKWQALVLKNLYEINRKN